MNNKKLGNDFESAFCKTLFEQGFWCHNLAQNQAGQPADVIAVRNGKAYLIDCKVCSKGAFVLSRIEENQDLAMELWQYCGNRDGWFAILIAESKKVYMIPHWLIKTVRNRHYCLSEKEIKTSGIPLTEWLKLV